MEERFDEGEKPQHIVDFAIFRDGERETLGAEAEAGVESGEGPEEPGAAVDAVFEGGGRIGRGDVGWGDGGGEAAVEEDFDGAAVVAGEFADLEGVGVGGGFPVDVAGVVGGFVGADAVEVAAGAAEVGFDFAGEGVEEFGEGVVGGEGGEDDGFAVEFDGGGFAQEAEGEAGGEDEEVVAMAAAAWEEDFGGDFDEAVAGDEREVEGGGEDGGRPLERIGLAGELDGERGREAFEVAEADAGGGGGAGGDVFGEEEFEFEAGEDEAAEEAGDEQEGDHGGEDQEEQIVAGEESGAAGEGGGEAVEKAREGEAVVDALAEEGAEAGEGQVTPIMRGNLERVGIHARTLPADGYLAPLLELHGRHISAALSVLVLPPFECGLT